jgi:ribonuclease HIII
MISRTLKIDKKELFSLTRNLKQYIIAKPNVKGLHSIYKYRGCTISIYENMNVLLQGINISLVYKNLFENIDISNKNHVVEQNNLQNINKQVDQSKDFKQVVNSELVNSNKQFNKNQNTQVAGNKKVINVQQKISANNPIAKNKQVHTIVSDKPIFTQLTKNPNTQGQQKKIVANVLSKNNNVPNKAPNQNLVLQTKKQENFPSSNQNVTMQNGKTGSFNVVKQTQVQQNHNPNYQRSKDTNSVKNNRVHNLNKISNFNNSLTEWRDDVINEGVDNSKIVNQIGSDEVGVGDYFGPLVVCAAFVKSEDTEKLWKLGVRDSKKMTDKQMERIYDELIKLIDFEIAIMFPKQYNELIDQKLTSHHLKTRLHNQALTQMNKRHINDQPVTTIIDQYANRNLYIKYCNDMNMVPAKIDIFESKAESKYISVAAASIIARVTFIRSIDYMSTQLNVKIPLGSSKVIESAKSIYKKLGNEKFKNLVKWHFVTTKQVVD